MRAMTEVERIMLDALRYVGCCAPGFIRNTGGCGNECVVCSAIAAAEGVLDTTDARKFDPTMDQNAVCACGHLYHRHFDSYDDMKSVGCKYCPCTTFTPRP